MSISIKKEHKIPDEIKDRSQTTSKHLGIEAEYVTSKRHGFLRAKLGENWIMLDPTWDEGEKVYEYFASEKLHKSRDKYHIPDQDLSQCSFVTLPQQFVNRLMSIVDNEKVNKKV